MASLATRNINEAPDEVRKFQAHGYAEVVTLEGFTIGRAVFEPGWKWSNDVAPIAGTDSCQTRHTGVCVSGEMTIRANDGTELTVRPGDVFVIEPGHDAWVIGTEPCIMYDTGIAAYAKAAH
jgi:mannose-6-phosphate isomerase-like protein (cupin superfamily)